MAPPRTNTSLAAGVLIDAMRKGYWIILDELNLAPTDVLEALNRLLDDNRELFVAETQEVIKAHPRFKLFATQNPPGLYGGRKVREIVQWCGCTVVSSRCSAGLFAFCG